MSVDNEDAGKRQRGESQLGSLHYGWFETEIAFGVYCLVAAIVLSKKLNKLNQKNSQWKLHLRILDYQFA